MDLGLEGKAFVMTGAARGLGHATAQALVSEGADVLISGRTEASLREAQERLGAGSAFLVTDNSDPEAGENLTSECIKRFGRIDGALISVGGPPRGSVMATSDADWRSSFESVFLGAVRIARSVATRCHENGSIVFVLSSSVKTPLAEMAISNGLRAGLAMVAKTLADELGPMGIRVNSLMPGRIQTDRVMELDTATGDPVQARRQAEQLIPLGRYGQPTEFGRVAAFLLSPASSYVTGVALPIDGGMLQAL